MEEAGGAKRYGDRIPSHYTIRAKKASSADGRWDVSIIRNISRTGVLFYSSIYYEVGSEIKIRIMNPVLVGEISGSANVVRCFPVTEVKGVYGVALEFTHMEPQDKEALETAINLFLKRKKKEEDA